MDKPETILIRIPNHLGDCLMAQPAVKALADLKNDAEICLLGPIWAESIFYGTERCTFIPLRGNILHGTSAISNQVRLLRKRKFNVGALMTPSFSSALIFFLAGIKNRYGYGGEGRSIFLNHSLNSAENQRAHRSIGYLHLLESLAGKNLRAFHPEYPIRAEEIQSAKKILIEAGIMDGSRYVAIAPQAVAESRRWGTQNYAALARRIISETGGYVILLGAADEYLAGEEVASNEKKIINLCGKTDISTAAALLSMARLFIGNDSGLAHLAASVDIPLVILSGADNPDETSPLSEKKTVIIRRELECISCVKNRCPKRGSDFMRCMNEISVEEVFTAATEHLGR